MTARETDDLDALGLLLEPPPAAPARPRALLLDHLAGRVPFAGFKGRFARLFQVNEDEAERVLASIPTAAPWEPFLPVATLRHFQPGPALQQPGFDAGLVRFEAGSLFPQHSHQGGEVSLVLQGGFFDQLTRRHVGPGDLLELPPGSAHAFRIDPGEPCIAAVLLLGPIAFL